MGYDGLFNLIDICVFGFGFYALYSAYVLQKEGKIIRTFLVFKETDLDSCKDLQGYVNCMAPKLRTFGLVMVIYGATSLINTYLVSIRTLFGVMMAAFFLVLIWYAMEVKKAMKKYF